MASKRPGFVRSTTDNLNGESSNVELKEIDAKDGTYIDTHDAEAEDVPPYDHEALRDGAQITDKVETAADLVTKVIHVDDDPNMRVWTFRVVFVGLGLSAFGSVLQEIFYFKPQTIFVSLIFLTVWAYILGDFLAFAIPEKIDLKIGSLHITDRGILRFFNPGPFNSKEHAAITIMASAASQSALATEALAAQELFYGGYPSKAAGIFIVITSQLIGFGVAGLLRDVIVHPVKTIHRDPQKTKLKLRKWYIIFFAIFFWEILPEWMFTTLIGISVFCLADQHNAFFSNFFGGATGNEGLGVLSFCFDWNYIAPFNSPFWLPFQTSVNLMVGIIGCYILFTGLYYGNIFHAKSLPFLSQELFNLTTSPYSVYNQSLILNDKFEIDYTKLNSEGTPYLTATYIGYLITTNMGMTATVVYMLLWNWDDMKYAWSWAYPSNFRRLLRKETLMFWKNQETVEERLRRKENDPNLDPHYKLMLRNGYKEVPLWWWFGVLLVCWVIGLACLYVMKSTLPWWGFLLATVFTFVLTLFFGTQFGMTGFQFNFQPICQMLSGYMFPGRPLANLYFTCFTSNAGAQAQLLGKDLRLAQYSHIPPRSTFALQLMGCLVGALLNWVMMISIVGAQKDVLVSIQGTSIWSGQNVQIFNTLAISWSIAPKMFSVGGKYEWVTLSFLLGFLVPIPTYILYKITGKKGWGYLNPSIILWYMGNLYVGINSGFTTFFIIAFVFQFYIRKYHPNFFVEWNYLLSAAFDGGTQVMVFILTFAVEGGSGTAHPFPYWAGNPNLTMTNTDHCRLNPLNDN